MGYYSEDFKAIAADPWGEAMATRLYIRLRDAENRLGRSNEFIYFNWYEAPTAEIDRTDVGSNVTRIDHLSGGASEWACIANDLLGIFDDPPASTSVRANSITFSTVVKYESAGKVGLSVYDDTDYVWYRAVFQWAGSGDPREITGYTLTDSIGKAGYIDLGTLLDDEDYAGFYHIWFALDLEALGIIGNDLDLRFHPDPENVSGLPVGVYIANAQVSYNLPYDDDPSPRGVVINKQKYTCLLDQPGTLITVADHEEILKVNPVTTKRDRSFGIIEAQQWQASITNVQRSISGYDLAGAWVAAEIGFTGADEWALLAQGRVAGVKISSNHKITLDVDSPMMDLLDGELTRDTMFDDTASASEITSVQTDDASSGYDNDASGAGITITTSADVEEQKWTIVFTSATAFTLEEEDGTSHSGYTISGDASPSGHGFTVELQGWDTGSGAYAVGDTFTFTMSKERSALDPVSLLIELLTDVNFLGLEVFDVIKGLNYGSALYEKTAVWDVAVSTYSTTVMKGLWPSGTRIVDMVQGILKVIHASIYVMPSGQFALWETEPLAASTTVLSGDITAGGAVQVISVEAIENLEGVYDRVVYKYGSLSTGAPMELETVKDSSRWNAMKTITVDLEPWRVDSASVDAAASKLLTRISSTHRDFKVRTTLAGAVIDLDEPIALMDPSVGAELTAIVRESTVDPGANEAQLVIERDPILLASYARVGDAGTAIVGSTVDGTDKVF